MIVFRPQQHVASCRIFFFALVFLLLSVVVSSPEAKTERLPGATAPQSGVITDRSLLETRKLQVEIDKLEAEISKLKSETDSEKEFGPLARQFYIWIGALGAWLVAGVGWWINRSFSKTQHKKLEQDRILGREKHNIELFQHLGHESLRVQLAAVAVLTQRLESFRERKKYELSLAEQLEKSTITRVLIAVTKKRDGSDLSSVIQAPFRFTAIREIKTEKNEQLMLAPPILLKFIADNLVRALGAKPEDEGPRKKPKTADSPLKEFDLQKVEFPDAWWKRVDARGVDFFEANLRKASLREAFLSKAVFYRANLQEATLRDADLSKANLQGADLSKTDLQGADLRQANLSQARLTEVKFNGAKVAGADLREAQWGKNPDGYVDISPNGDGSQMKAIREWLQ